jgi:hypothetical protein
MLPSYNFCGNLKVISLQVHLKGIQDPYTFRAIVRQFLAFQEGSVADAHGSDLAVTEATYWSAAGVYAPLHSQRWAVNIRSQATPTAGPNSLILQRSSLFFGLGSELLQSWQSIVWEI